MSFPPQFYLIGAQKAGTSTLAHLLDQHPQVRVSRPKEPDFFSRNWSRGLDWYKQKFPDLHPSPSVLVDASTSYSRAPLTQYNGANPDRWREFKNVPQRVFSVNPDAKFIYLMRDPVERTYSGYWQSVRQGYESNGEFRSALKGNAQYLDISDYHGQLSLWLEYFSLGSFFFVLFEDLKGSPEGVAEKCFEFMDIDTKATVTFDAAKNESRVNSWLGRKVNNLLNEHPDTHELLAATMPKVPDVIRKGIRRVRYGSAPLPPMNNVDRGFLIEYFRERNSDLAHLTGIRLDRWQT